jgi:hypothetical protein
MKAQTYVRVILAALVAGLVGGFSASGGSDGEALAQVTTPAPVWGYADIHTHQFSNLGLSGLVAWGDVFRDDDDIAKALAWDDFTPASAGQFVDPAGNPVPLLPFVGLPPYPNVPATCPAATGTLLNPCFGVAVHGASGSNDVVNTFVTHTPGHLSGGYPQFDGWPRWNNYTGQQMYYRWLERAWRGGLRLMVMLA